MMERFADTETGTAFTLTRETARDGRNAAALNEAKGLGHMRSLARVDRCVRMMAWTPARFSHGLA
jgi:hypothetical protein